MAPTSPLLVLRGTNGIALMNVPPQEGPFKDFKREESKACKDMEFTKSGHLFAWCNGHKVNIISTESYQEVLQIDKPRTTYIKFSPEGTVFATWEPYIALKDNPQDNCNLHLWDVKTGACLKSFIQKKQVDWCPKWSDDERLCARNVNNEVHFYDGGEYGNIEKKIFLQKVSNFSLAPGPPPYHVACYVPGVKGQPCSVRLFSYPKFEGPGAVISQKSFFKADRTEFHWNKLGKDLVLQTILDVDKSGSSYYGEQNLYHLSVKGDTTKVKLDKDGPIYSLQWSPNGTEFCVVYGFMPAKATIYNRLCEPVFDFGSGPRNEVNYNLFGNRIAKQTLGYLILETCWVLFLAPLPQHKRREHEMIILVELSGFGNLRGNIEVWDLKVKKKVSQFQASDSTQISLCPDGELILTATTSPRLRIANGYRIWHYTGSLLQEVHIGQDDELWDIQWHPSPEGTFEEKTILYTPVPGIQSSQPEASKQAYRPPGARGQPSTFKLRDDEPASAPVQNDTTSKSASRNKRKKEAKKAKKEKEKTCSAEEDNANESLIIHPLETVPLPPETTTAFTGNPEKDKKIKALLKKLDQISKLKEDQQLGKLLEKNQQEKIKREDEFLEELKQLQI